jgi:hypothetical protein
MIPRLESLFQKTLLVRGLLGARLIAQTAMARLVSAMPCRRAAFSRPAGRGESSIQARMVAMNRSGASMFQRWPTRGHDPARGNGHGGREDFRRLV